MRMRNKVLISIGLVWILFLMITFASSEFLILKTFVQLENNHVNPNLMRHLIYIAGEKTTHYYLIAFIILGIVFSLIMMWLLRMLITKIEKQTNDLQVFNLQLTKEITERESVEKDLIIHKEHLVRLAHYDKLTALPNRVFFNEMLNKNLSNAARHHQSFAILFIDLDRFKSINDTFGHSMGDLVLKKIADRFSNVLRTEDLLARLGGDEFIVLINDIENPKFAGTIAEKILNILHQPIEVNSHEFYLAASIGISLFPNDGNSLEELQKNADIAMYKAKHESGNTYQYFTQDMTIAAREYMEIETALRKAITNNEFVLHYQPKLDLKEGIITGVEALIRWENPELGLVTPNAFISIAEETGLIIKIGEWVIREACRANKSWQDQGYQPISVAVNLSAKQFYHQDISNLVEIILNENKLSAKYLELEITETAITNDIENTINKLKSIKQMGVRISIDDFGTGYTSINHLKKFPIDFIKIDQSFIKGLPHNQNDIAITSAMIALAHNLGIKVVAEGVEAEEQLQFLATHQCDMVQGYYLGRPLPEHKLLSLLTKNEQMIS